MELAILLGIIFFLGAYGLRGLLILVIVGGGVVALLLYPSYRNAQHLRAEDAALAAECIAHPPTDDIGQFLCSNAGKQP